MGEDAGGETALVGLEWVDALLDGVLAQQLVDEDRLGLADAVGAIGSRSGDA